MRRRLAIFVAAMATMLSIAGAAWAQSAAIRGRIVDEQKNPVSGVRLSLTNPRTGAAWTGESDAQGFYRFEGLTPGAYEFTASRDGFATVKQQSTILQVGSVIHLDITLTIAVMTETVTIVAPGPLVESTSAVVGGVVEPRRIQQLPLNGRQFANLSGTLPGVGVAFHRDPSKGTQYSPQVNGGAGRSVNNLVDGGDNNDDTVGGQMQLFPLDAIEEFRLSTASYAAAHGRASGGILEVVTRSGTNTLSGSAFGFFRHETLNARTTTEMAADVPKPDYQRWQYGGSAGGPIRRDVAHFFAAFERVQQDTFQAVDTRGLFPELDGVFPVAYRENLILVKPTWRVRAADQVWIRYGANTTSQPAGVGPTIPPQSWGDNRNRFHSINGRYARILSGRALNELTVQYATFLNTITTETRDSTQVFPNGVVIGVGMNIPQSTEQRKIHLRDDVSLHTRGGGLDHAIKAGVEIAHDLRLGFPAHTTPPGYLSYVHLTNDPAGPLSSVAGSTGTAPVSYPALEIPLTHVGSYLQDDWRVTNRLTVNAGVRYDVVIGYQIDQSNNPNFVALQEAARSGRFAGVIGMEDFGLAPRDDLDNFQPRVGFALDVKGGGGDVIRGGWGIYVDAAYTNSNVLFAAGDAQGVVVTGQFVASDPNGIRNPDGSFYRVGEPISNIAALNEGGTTGLIGEVVSPRLQLPYARQASFGWSHRLNASMAFTADLIHAAGRNLNVRARLNSRPDGGSRRFAGIPIEPNSGNFRVVISPLRSAYDALLLSLRRRSAAGFDLAINYTLSRAKSDLGQAVDETGLGPNTIQDATDPFARSGYGPAASDARHLLAVSAIVPLKGNFQVAPVFYYRSALPVFITDGVDRNGDFNNNDIPDRAFAFDGIGKPPRETGACRTINCGRGAASSQLNLRVSKRIMLRGASRLDLLAEVFNLFDASNPSAFNARRQLGTAQNPEPNPSFMQPSSFAGDFQRPEQRVGQVALRWSY